MTLRRTKISYGSAPSNFGHLYVPDAEKLGDGRAPLVVLVHGGFWSTEFSLVVYTAVARSLADRGVVVWNVEYRRREEDGGGWPGTGRDVVDAIRALDGPVLDHLSTVGVRVDASNVAVVGHSAGGHLAVWAVGRLRGATERFRIGTVVAQSAVLDFTETGACARPSVISLMGAPYTQIPERYREASPNCIEPFDSLVAVIHTVDDESVPIEMSRRYVQDARARGQRVALYEVPAADHAAFVDPASAAARQTLRVLGV